jgi:hypothetical protein
MTSAVMCHGPALSGLEGKAGLGSVEGLDLRLFVDRQHDGMGRRVHVEVDNVHHLLGKGGIVGALEGSDTVRLEAMGGPDALDGAQRDPHLLGHGATGPVRSLARRFTTGQRQHLGHGRGRQRRPAGWARLVAQQSVDACLAIAPLPAPYRRPADAGALGHLGDRQALGRKKNDPRPLDMLVRAIAIADDCGQSRAIIGRGTHAKGLGHGARFACLGCLVNPVMVSVH